MKVLMNNTSTSTRADDNSDHQSHSKRLLSKEEVLFITSLKTTTLYKLIKIGKFPKQVKMGRRSFWWKHEVESYMESLPRAGERNE